MALLDSLGHGLLEPHGAIKITIIRIRKFAENILHIYEINIYYPENVNYGVI